MKSKNLLQIILLVLSISSFAQNGLSNLSFETWSSSMFGPSPTGWTGFNVSKQSTGAQQGTNYVRITNTNINQGTMMLGTISTGTVFKGGAAYSQMPLSVNGFYKTSGLATNDVVGMTGYTSKAGTINSIGSFTTNTNQSGWTSFSMPFIAFNAGAVDTLFIIASSGNLGGGGGSNSVGATFDLDNLSLVTLTGIDQKSMGTSFLVYPNPASTNLTIISKEEKAAFIVVTDLTGKITDEILIETEKTNVDLQNYGRGIYFYAILDRERNILLTNKLVIDK